jgi:hypothetical protein
MALPGLRVVRSPGFRFLAVLIVLLGALSVHLIDVFAAWHNWTSTSGTTVTADFNSWMQSGHIILGGGSPYQPLHPGRSEEFIAGALHQPYPPTFFILMAPWVVAPEWLRFGSWLLLQEVALAAIFAAVWAGLGRPGRVEAALAVALVLPFLPVRQNLFEGQMNVVITALAALALLAWQNRRPIPGGVLLGLAIALKPTALLVLLYFAYRRAWRLVLATGGIAALLVAGTFLMGWGHLWVPFLQLLGPLGRGSAFIANQSVNGFILRAWRPELSGEPIDPLPVGIQLGIYAADLVLASVVLFGLRGLRLAGPRLWWTEFAVVLVLLTLVQPLAWFHHHAAAVIAIVVAVRLAATGALRGRVIAGLLAAYGLVTFIAYPVHLAARPMGGAGLYADPELRWATSAAFAGLVAAAVLLTRARPRDGMGVGW